MRLNELGSRLCGAACKNAAPRPGNARFAAILTRPVASADANSASPLRRANAAIASLS